jgi:hypothetical protein
MGIIRGFVQASQIKNITSDHFHCRRLSNGQIEHSGGACIGTVEAFESHSSKIFSTNRTVSKNNRQN